MLDSARLKDVVAAGEVVALDDERAVDAGCSGAKAANLARCAHAGLPVLPGFVLSTQGVADFGSERVTGALCDAWAELSGDGRVPVVVRSSSTVEDAEQSSLAGRFTSVLDVSSWSGFVEAARTVIASATHVLDDQGAAAPMAVLVQAQLAARVGGVLFGVDPIAGDRRRLVVAVVPGRPDALVSGRVTVPHAVLTRSGRLLVAPDDVAVLLPRRRRRALARLARDAARTLGGPQDIEWAEDAEGKLWLLQSRPVTAVAAERRSRGPVFGPGPVAETFPEPLRPLEDDLWIAPLREGVRHALRLTGAVSRRRLRSSPVVRTVGGWAAADLDLLGVREPRSRVAARLNPIAPARRLGAAWRVGRLRVALPRLAGELVARVDDDLAEVPELALLTNGDLVTLLRRARGELRCTHGYEVLAGMLLHDEPGTTPAPAIALSTVAHMRGAGATDREIVATAPVVLALCAPSIARAPTLPQIAMPASRRVDGARVSTRDALRLRSRWLQELTARAVAVIGARLEASGMLEDAALVGEFTLDDLSTLVARTTDDGKPVAPISPPVGPPLPLEFRLSTNGAPVALAHSRGQAEGLPTGSGRGVGHVRSRVRAEEAEDAVLVVGTLDPGLAPLLPHLAGLVAETGSALSHLAILAREYGVPTVVGVANARRRFPPGSYVLVDGATGEVRTLEQEV